MTQSHRPFRHIHLLFFSLLALFVVGCKKPVEAPKPAPPPPPPAVKPTASLTADRTVINKGESVKLSWTTTDATNVSIAPEVGAVTPQGSTSVNPAESTTYTLTATGAGGNTDSTVRITVNIPPPPPPPAKTESFDEIFAREVRDAYFDYNSAEIRADARTALQKTADFLKGYPNLRVTIEGHCDERGSTEYNLALGQRRANAVKQYLVSLGISGDHLDTTSWGKEKPVCTESNEACWQQNRRGHFVPNK